MFATVGDVLEFTGMTVIEAVIQRAQAIVEVAAGRTENMVSDYDDQEWLRYATAWQSAYMADASVFEQANVKAVSQNDSRIDFGDRLYALAPLAVEAIRRLSWKRSRSVPTKPIGGEVKGEGWEYA